MKKFLSILIGAASLFLALPDLRAAAGSTFTPSPTLRGINRDVYIAIRTDGAAGSGTFTDPFDGSTAAKFDAAFVAAVTSSARIHLGPGTFLTSGNGFATFRFGLTGGSWVVQGAGVGVTTVKLSNNIVTAVGGAASVFGQHADDVPSGQTPEYVEICDMTLDANRSNQSAVSGGLTCTVGCVGIGARRTYLHDLHGKSAYGKNNECFVVATAAPAVPDASTVIENVYVTDLSGWATAINAAGTKSTNRMRGVIQNCRVIGDNTTSAGLGQNGVGGWWLDGFVFANNRVHGVVGGVIVDSFTNNSLTITGNKIFAPYGYGVIMNGAGANNNDITIENNYFAPGGGTGVLLDTVLPANLLILGNQNDATAAGTTNQITKAELNYLKGGTNNFQAQLNQLKSGGGISSLTNVTFYGSQTFIGSDQQWKIQAIDTPNSLSFMYQGTNRFTLGTGRISPYDIGYRYDLGASAQPFSTLFVTNITYATGQPQVKAQVVFDASSGSVVVLSSYNATVTGNSAGDFTINFTTAMSTTNYAAQLSGRGTSSQPARIFVEQHDSPVRTASALRLYCLVGTTGAPTNPERYCVTIFE